MATKKAADSTLYHLSPKGFWKKFRDAVVVNPEISSGLPLQGVNRFPPPGSRPEKYSTPASKASDIAQNPYWKRDVRRAYPQLSVITQTGLSSLLIEHSTPQPVAAPAEGDAANGSKAVSAPQETLELAAAISKITESTKIYSASKLPPTLPLAYPRWQPQRAPDAPHAQHAYFPMHMYK
ncbi:NUZM, NADH-ubiquinone oxidoreductase 21.3 kDa subunit [Lentinula aciculospora]|uniref:NUZM, NADH-ubiquinone oxidoreductase 21.3 kDa subunit n=1 Tax=Lentinula aciculospora TaxID=153920 RepID=A0A9W9DSS3_9AGAR|nr:NUZM, NADH-ubiquinone oxidoreductase 21.3 kDa subunit [Lentinula aciculospora]